MGKALAFALGVGLLAAACGDDASSYTLPRATSTQNIASREPVAYGWTRPVTAKSFADASTKLGKAQSTIAGHSLRAIVTDARVRVRGDDNACTKCHDWAGDISRDELCDRVPAFNAEPTSKGDGTDPLAAKPEVLKELLGRWHAAGCPE